MSERGHTPPPRRARALVRRYLDPRRSWDAALDGELRTLCRASDGAAVHYRKAVVRHRMLVGSSPGLPSGFEAQRMRHAVIPARATPQGGRWRSTGAWLRAGLLAAAVILAAILVPTLAGEAPRTEWLRARGLSSPAFPEPLVGVGVSGVTAAGVEYEAVAGGGVRLGDFVRFSYTNERPELGYLFVVGVQPHRAVGERLVWLAPTPEEGRSRSVSAARLRDFPFEIRVGARHAAGPMHYVAIFSAAPLSTAEVARALDPSDAVPVPSEVTERLTGGLPAPAGLVVQVLSTRVRPGSEAEEVSP